MVLYLKKIIEFNNKEDLTKIFEEVMKKALNEKRVLIVLMIQMNPSLLIKQILESNHDQRSLELISLFCIVIHNDLIYNLLNQNNYEEIQRISSVE
jgi:hypothetical protein